MPLCTITRTTEIITTNREKLFEIVSGEIAFGVDSRFAPHAGSGDGLAVVWVGNIACSKHTFDIGRCSLTGCDDVALSIEVDLSAENIGVWLVSDSKEESIDELSPAKISGTRMIPIGRIRKLAMGPEYISAFTVGDQLLWGAAEPLRRMLRIVTGSSL